jgi:hypothetical protein
MLAQDRPKSHGMATVFKDYVHIVLRYSPNSEIGKKVIEAELGQKLFFVTFPLRF